MCVSKQSRRGRERAALLLDAGTNDAPQRSLLLSPAQDNPQGPSSVINTPLFSRRAYFKLAGGTKLGPDLSLRVQYISVTCAYAEQNLIPQI